MTTRLAPATVALVVALAALLLAGYTSTTDRAPVAMTERPRVPRTTGDSTVLVEVTASQPAERVAVRVLGVNAGLTVPQTTLTDQPTPLHRPVTFHRGPGAGTLGVSVRSFASTGYSTLDCTITVDGQVVLRDPATTRCTYSEDPASQYLLEKGIP